MSPYREPLKNWAVSIYHYLLNIFFELLAYDDQSRLSCPISHNNFGLHEEVLPSDVAFSL